MGIVKYHCRVKAWKLEKEDPLVILDVDNKMVRKQQLAQLDRIKSRDTKVQRVTAKLIDCKDRKRKLTRNSRRRCKKQNHSNQ
jgi:methylmalonyl-CoA mutase N-terminal domain/subunit